MTVLATVVVTCASLAFLGHSRERSTTEVTVAGVQFEFGSEKELINGLEALVINHPEAQLFVLSEYSFDGPIPAAVKRWCARRSRYLIAGGKQYLSKDAKDFYNTAFVIGPDGEEVFQQGKAVPIQFFKDGRSADRQLVWKSPWGKIGLCVCYDLSYTRVIDELVRQGASALIVPTMDVQEWGERQHRLHARVAPIRAAEYGIPIFRLCSSGISQGVDGHGRVKATAPFPGQGATIVTTLRLPSQRLSLPLDRWLAWPSVFLTVVLLGWHLLDGWRTRKERGAKPGAGGRPAVSLPSDGRPLASQ